MPPYFFFGRVLAIISLFMTPTVLELSNRSNFLDFLLCLLKDFEPSFGALLFANKSKEDNELSGWF